MKNNETIDVDVVLDDIEKSILDNLLELYALRKQLAEIRKAGHNIILSEHFLAFLQRIKAKVV